MVRRLWLRCLQGSLSWEGLMESPGLGLVHWTKLRSVTRFGVGGLRPQRHALLILGVWAAGLAPLACNSGSTESTHGIDSAEPIDTDAPASGGSSESTATPNASGPDMETA